MSDPLEKLIVNEGDLAREALAEVLQPLVRFTQDGNLLPEPSFDELPTIRRVACLLLAFKAAHLLGLRDRPGAPPKELVEMSGMPGGTVRPKLTELVNLRLVTKNGDDYVVPPHGMRRVADLLRREDR